jgi:HAE1 family hydrophobic/amphiphilic exporter-1
VNLSEPFIRRPVMTALLTLSAIVFGVMAYQSLPVNDLPAVDYPVIQVQVGYPGATPETMANNVATPLEKQFMKIPGLEVVTSSSGQGHSSITLQFVLSKNIDAAATDVQTAITQASGQLPVDLPSPPTFSKNNPNDQPIMYIGLTSDTVTRGQLWDYGSTQIGQRISILPGVSKVDVYGVQSAVRIKADPSAMAVRGIAVDDLAASIRGGTSYQGAGQFDGAHRTFLLQPQGQLVDAAGYNNLIIGTNNGQPIYLRDVAAAHDSVADDRVDMRFWIRGRTVPKATVVIAVSRQAGANAVEVARSVRALLPSVRATIPPSIQIVPIYDRSLSIVHSVQDVRETLLIAFILVVAVIFAFLGRATDTLIPAVALPLSLLLTFIVMQMLGYSLDNLSLMALTLAIGFLVDDAIVFLENTVRRLEEGETPAVAAINSAKEISFTILSMTISLAAVFLPLVFMSGLVGRIFREFSITIIVSIFASGIVSLTLTPLMCARLLKQRGHGIKKTWVERVIGGVETRVLGVYGRSLWFFLRHRWISAATWVVCLVGTVLLFRAVPKAFLPIGDSSFIWGVMIAQEGTAPAQMRQYQSVVEDVVHANPSVDMTFTMTGNAQFLGSNQGLVLAFLKDPAARPGQMPIQGVAGQLMGSIVGQVPGLFAFLQPQPNLQISTGATRNNQGQYAYAISGIDPNEVYAVAGQLMGKFYQQQGKLFASVSSDMFNHTPNLQIDILRDEAALYGVSAAKIETLLRTAYSQNYIYLIKRPNDQYQVILEVQDKNRTEPDDLSLLYVRSDDGKRLVPLSAVAKWKPALGPQSVNHLNQFTSVTFFFNLVPGVPVGNATDYIEKTAASVLPQSMRGSLQGEALTFRDTVSSLVVLMFLAVFVMYVILGILYESYLHPITVLSALPVALVGGLATLLLFGSEASLYAFIGMFMLMGIVKKNGIMIVDFALQRVAHGETAEKAIHDASMDRFRPIMMTTLAAVMGAIPIAIGWGADGASRRPLGLVIVGGLIVSQFITLYVTPVIYLYLELFQEKVLDRTSFFRSSHIMHEQAAPMPEIVARGMQPVPVDHGENGDS